MAYADASDRLDAVTVSDVIAHALPALRVEQQRPDGPRCIIWRNPPSDADQAKALELVGTASHAW